jgi:hypothetical protein
MSILEVRASHYWWKADSLLLIAHDPPATIMAFDEQLAMRYREALGQTKQGLGRFMFRVGKDSEMAGRRFTDVGQLCGPAHCDL